MKPVKGFYAGISCFYTLIIIIFSHAQTARPYRHSTYFEADPQPVKLHLYTNPLDYAAGRIGIDARGFELPRAYEGDYRFACRLPVIDQVSNQPLYLKQWAEDQSALLSRQHAAGGITVILDALTLLCGSSWTAQIQDNNKQRSIIIKALTRSPFTAKYRRALTSLYLCYFEALGMVKRSHAFLDEDDRSFLNANPGYYITPDGVKMPDLTGNVKAQFEYIEVTRRVRLEYIMSAAQVMSVALQKYVENTKDYTIADFYSDTARKNENFMINAGSITLSIYGGSDDIHDADELFLIDIGGNDTYRNNAGSCRTLDDGVAVCIDHAGNDKYCAPDRDYVQGFGFLGAGFLIDLTGDDTYKARHFSQGAGIAGVGALWDLRGNDRYCAQTFCQGAGAFGLGICLDDSGNEQYDCASLGQGGATTLGMGVLSDLAGDDTYYLNWTADKNALGQIPGYGQGGALSFRNYPWRKKLTAYGGIGLLTDAGGNDIYLSKAWCVQGGSYIMSLGVLYDGSGDDTYYAQSGQGSGIHVTNAILIDRQGNDKYEGDFRCGGSGGDRTPGFLIDYQGNDTYISKTSSYGTGVKPFSYSLFIDYQGDDTYICREPKDKITFDNWDSFGGVWPESEPYLWPYAICLDLGGNDNYLVRNRMNNSERHSFGHGIHMDMEWTKGDVIGPVNSPLPPYRAFKIPAACRSSPYRTLLVELTDPHLFVRFEAIGKIVNKGPVILPFLVLAIQNSGHRQVNRDIMECIHYFFTSGALAAQDMRMLIPLLHARDAEVRLTIADDFGLWGYSGAESLLTETLASDSMLQVRRFALRSLLELRSIHALPTVRRLAFDDPSEDVRRIAVRFLSRIRDSTNPYGPIEKALRTDASPAVRTAAAEGLGYLRDPLALKALRTAGKSTDIYLQRAAGKALADLYQAEGIQILIKTMSFPSIDAFYNYDRNVPNYVMAYTNHDLPDSVRYDQNQWQKWFNRNKKKIDIKTNADAFREYSILTDEFKDSTTEAQLLGYEALLQRYPGQKIIINRIAALKEQ
jgi:hypothetical protein